VTLIPELADDGLSPTMDGTSRNASLGEDGTDFQDGKPFE
jgi:hypothetical protein